MKTFEVEVTAMVTISITKSFPVEAETIEEAKLLANKMYQDEIDDEYGYADYDEVEYGYIGVLKQ